MRGSPALSERVSRVMRGFPAELAGEEMPLLVGFSGGRDSVALVALLMEAGWRRLVLCHLDHGVRMGSEADARWARRWAEERGLVFRERRVRVLEFAAELGKGVEEAGREARYAFFQEVGREMGIRGVVLAHHADDQVETLLFRLLRGTGIDGLGGMRPMAQWNGVSGMAVMRPMLGIWREELSEWLSGQGLDFREDPTNAEMRFTRNRIRHRLLPELETAMGRPVKEALLRASELLRGEAEWGDQRERELGPVPMELGVRELRAFPVALRRRRVMRWLREKGPAGVGFEEVESVLGLLSGGMPARVNLPGGWFARRREGRIFLEAPVDRREGLGQG